MKLENFKQTMKQYFEYMEACDRDGMLGLFAENAQIQVAILEPYWWRILETVYIDDKFYMLASPM